MTRDEAIDAAQTALSKLATTDKTDTEVGDVIDRAIKVLGSILRMRDPETFIVRKSLTSNTHVFSLPSDCRKVIRVWDLMTTAKAITGATNASPIVITAASHGFSTGDVITIHDVGGNTAANGVWSITKVDDGSFSLDDSTGNADYTSGGYAFKETSAMREMRRIYPQDATYTDRYAWYMRQNNIVVDYPSFSNSLVIDYEKTPSEISEIPEDYHDALVAYAVIHLVPLADAEALFIYRNAWDIAVKSILDEGGYAEEPKYFKQEISFENLMV